MDEFISNIENNKEANKFFDSCDVLDENKEIKISKQINGYIKSLQKREEESQERALTAAYGGTQSQMMSQGDSCMTSSPGEYGESKINNSSKI